MPYRGNYTKTDLRDLSWYQKANGGTLDRQAARFGLELAQLAYDFDFAPWLEAGWTDATIQVDARLISGVRAGEELSDWRQQALNLLLPRLAQGLKVFTNPIKEINQYLWKRDAQETGKAVVLLRPDGGGRFTVAIGFMGTGKRPQDWAGNMRFRHEDDFHQGFSAIAGQFEKNAGSIRFPTAAAALGLEDLTLKDVLASARQPDSPFRLLMAGHSQGAAVLQVWTYRRLMEGVRRENLLGFGYASPVVSANLKGDEALVPLTHFLVSDDIFTRVGLQDHLGACYRLEPDEDFRAVCYGENLDDPLFTSTLGLFATIGDTRNGLLFCLSYLDALSTRPMKSIGPSLAAFMERSWAESLAELPVFADDLAEKLLAFTQRGFKRFYADLTGGQAESEAVSALSVQIAEIMDRFGAIAFSQMLVKALHLTHSLVGREPGMSDHAPYSYLVVRAFDQLRKVEEPAALPCAPLTQGPSEKPAAQSPARNEA